MHDFMGVVICMILFARASELFQMCVALTCENPCGGIGCCGDMPLSRSESTMKEEK